MVQGSPNQPRSNYKTKQLGDIRWISAKRCSRREDLLQFIVMEVRQVRFNYLDDPVVYNLNIQIQAIHASHYIMEHTAYPSVVK